MHRCRFVKEHRNIGMDIYRPIHCRKRAVYQTHYSFFCEEHS